jgi:hypothetical protein
MDGMSMASAVPDTKRPPDELMGRFAGLLDSYEHQIERLTGVIGAVLVTDGPSDMAMSKPMEAEYHAFHHLLLRLEILNERLVGVTDRVRL